MTWARHTSLAVLLAVLGGCGGGALTSLRFENRPIVWQVDDRRPVPRPDFWTPGGYGSKVQSMVRNPVLDTLSVPGSPLAMNINSLGEVPDSSWFENRIGTREMDPRELLERASGGGPDTSAPWTVVKGKDTGAAPGFLIEDAKGDKYLLKFDPADAPETESGAEVVVQRLLWAAGYNVPDNSVVYFRREDVRLSPDAKKRVPHEGKAPMTDADLDRILDAAPKSADGVRWRAMASKYLPGIPAGHDPMEGVREVDPNDRVPHEHRRDVRAQKVFFAWLGHTDVKERNTLVMWSETAPDSSTGVLQHYILDFGKALGTWAGQGRHEHDGFSPHFHYGYAAASLFTFGLWKRPWEEVSFPRLQGLGRYEAERFDPDLYSPAIPYLPFFRTDRFDSYWAAKIIARFGPAHIAAAVDAGKYSDPRTRAYLIATIMARQKKIVRHWFSQVAPIDDFQVESRFDGWRVCARDLGLVHGLQRADTTRYRIEGYSGSGGALGFELEVAGAADGRVCVSGLRAAAEPEGYTILSYTLSRDGDEWPPVLVHLARNPKDGTPRVIGIQRK